MSKSKKSVNFNLILFFLITFIWSWAFWVPCMFSSEGLNEFNIWILFIIGAFGPFVGSHVITGLSEGKQGIKILWKRFLNFKIKIQWVIFIFLLFPALMGIAYILSYSETEFIWESVYFSQPWLILITFFTIFLYGGPFNEEFGWRGFVLERFQGKWSALISSIFLGIIWGFWHLPLFFIIGSSQEGQPFLLFVVMTCLLSILFTLIHNNTDGNILAAMLFYTMFNLTYVIVPFTKTVLGIIYFGILLIITDLLMIFIFGASELKRKKKLLMVR